MDQNIVVVMIDEELERLRQVRDIMESLLPSTEQLEPLLESAERDEPAEEPAAVTTGTDEAPAPDAAPAVKLRNSRRGMRTGPRGPRLRKLTVAPRALDSAVPSAPVVVSPGSLHLVTAPPPSPRPVKSVPTHKLDSLLAAAFANLQ